MGIFKDTNTKLIYEIISKSPEIQNLIRKIVGVNGQIYSNERNNIKSEIEKLTYKLSQTESKLDEANEELKKYKDFYNSSKGKVEEYEELVKVCELQKDGIENYKFEITKKDKEIETLKHDTLTLESEKNCLVAELNLEKENVKKLKKQFEYPIKYLELYRGLSDSVKSGLENVISSKNEILFIASCSNEENLSAIWEYIKDISLDIKNRDFEVLNLIFDYFFDIFNESMPEVKYKRDDVEIGEEFDNDCHDRCYGSATSGEITKIILRGYKLRNTGKIIHKSLVKV